MDCCAPKKEPEKNRQEIENVKQGTHEKEASHGGCCGGGNMKLHLLLMVIVFALIWVLSGR